MPHKFHGNWDHYKIGDLGFPNPPIQGGDFVLAINDAGVVNPQISSVDGDGVVSGQATGNRIDILTTRGRRYLGHLVKPLLGSGGDTFLVIAGRFAPQQAVAKGRGARKKEPDQQDEGTWVIIK